MTDSKKMQEATLRYNTALYMSVHLDLLAHPVPDDVREAAERELEEATAELERVKSETST